MKYINTIEEVEKAIQDEKVIIKFETSWCNPCVMVSKQLELVEKSRKDIAIYTVDITDNVQLFAKEFNITSVPTIFYCHKGHILNRTNGFLPKHMIINTLDKALEDVLE